MNNSTLDQKLFSGSDKATGTTTKVQRKPHTAIPEGSIMEGLMDFAFAIPDFRRTDKGNIRHCLADTFVLIILARASGCVGRMDIIEFGRHNLRRLRGMGLLNNGVPSEATLCRVEQGVDELRMAGEMAHFIERFHRRFRDKAIDPEIICVDEKAMCQAQDQPFDMARNQRHHRFDL